MGLTLRTFTLIIEGAKQEGNFKEAYRPMEEAFYTNEIDEVIDFCEWIDKNVGGASYTNIETLYKAYKNPSSKHLANYVAELKEKISQIRQLVRH